MIDALISGKLIKDPSLRTGQSGNNFTQFLLSVHTGEEEVVIDSVKKTTLRLNYPNKLLINSHYHGLY